ncbi:L-Ala-D/L-Glu epimerase [Nocardioides aquaticus]|uniref:L-Ala-D/L-Glu epimerase n=1 Tax=Nocardioides aquaticus TaxID=160826 RepID=A0ABX8EI38_9ACTN|nr:enolase C-terminal domain-like protein [Nocardioides aquaticus]QVT78758.1 L-Ala-D/L-Glu epimerase [Nocardioides aquaticus]
MTGARVVEVRAVAVSAPLHTPFVTAVRRTTTVDTVVVTVTDDDGVTGWGEAPQAWRITGDSLAGTTACVEGPVRDALVGGPADPREAWPRLAGCAVGNAGAKMAVDTALHDLAARRAGVPLAVHLAAHLGVAGTPAPDLRVPTDVTLAAGEPAALAAAARDRVADGFAVLKIKVGTSAATDVARVRAVRAAVGHGVELRLDANQGWDARSAVRVVRELEDDGLGVTLVEQPVPARDHLGLAHVRAHVDTPVMADESLVDLEDLVSLVRLGACDAVNVKLAKCGGLTPAAELLEVAARHGLGTMVGSMMESHLGVGAAGSLVAAVGTTWGADLDAGWWAAASPYVGGPAYQGPVLVLPDAPGLGVTGLALPGS